MEWSHSDAIGTSEPACAYCKGMGVRPLRRRAGTVCNCTLRGVFRACLNRFRSCWEQSGTMTHATLDKMNSSRSGFRTWGRRNEEYMADFYLIAKRELDDQHFLIFKFHFLLGADWRLCCRRLSMDRGNFFHSVYRIQQKLGRAFREIKPYGIFPIDEYFGGKITSGRVKACEVVAIRGPKARLDVPLRVREAA